jgi:COMPASS component SWD2
MDLMLSFRVGKVFKDASKRLCSVDFDDCGELCVSNDEESLRVYDVRDGKIVNSIFSKKYGCGTARFTHSSSSIVYSSTKHDDAIRYMSTYDNKFIRYFNGHKRKVTNIEVSPQDDSFLSCSLDNSVRLWALDTPKCAAILKMPKNDSKDNSVPCVAYDQAGNYL